VGRVGASRCEGGGGSGGVDVNEMDGGESIAGASHRSCKSKKALSLCRSGVVVLAGSWRLVEADNC
jgi:hypothetical protein